MDSRTVLTGIVEQLQMLDQANEYALYSILRQQFATLQAAHTAYLEMLYDIAQQSQLSGCDVVEAYNAAAEAALTRSKE